MKILILSYSDAGGGAAIAAYSLVKALRTFGVDAFLGVIEKTRYDDFIFQVRRKNNIAERIKRIVKRILFLNRVKTFATQNPVLHSMNTYSKMDISTLNNSDFDVIHLHWVNNDMISIEGVARIRKPLVWTLHDSWVFCGAEHHPNIFEDDKRYIDGYLKNNMPKTSKGIDVCRRTWLRKQKNWKGKIFNFVSPSNWLAEELKKSKLFYGTQCKVIPNVIPGKIFNKIDYSVKKVFGIPTDKIVIGFGAAYEINNRRSIKGGDQLIKALNLLEKEKYFLLVFGQASEEFVKNISIPSFYAGFQENQNILAALYNCCDVFVLPSVIENLATTALEAMFCGVPVVAYDTGGNKDIVEHLETGYLAKLFDYNDMANGIRYCIENRDFLSQNALRKVDVDFSENKIIGSYVDIYNDAAARK